MRKFLFILLTFFISVTPVMADDTILTTQNLCGSSAPDTELNFATSTDTTDIAQLFVAPVTGTLQSVTIPFGSRGNSTATATAQGVFRIYSEAGGNSPNSPLTIPGFVPNQTVDPVSTYTFFNNFPGIPAVNSSTTPPVLLSVTAGQSYWLTVVKYNAAPSSAHFTARALTTGVTGHPAIALNQNSGQWLQQWGNAEVCLSLQYSSLASSSIATSTIQTIDNPVQDLFEGFVIFFISLIFIIWFFKKR